MELREKIGQMLVAGFRGTEPPPEFVRLVREYGVANVILFAHNIESAPQLRRLCGQVQALVRERTGRPAFITIDQEGGVVTRLPEDTASLPGAMAIAAGGDPARAFEAGRITGEELRACGVNFNLAPVADVNSNPDNPVIGVRSYGDRPESVVRYLLPMLRGLQAGGVLACVKHFPGHGDTAVDSHLGLPTVDKSLEELEACELAPFRAAIGAGTDAVMTTHIRFPRLEPDGLPATLSRRILTGLLRETLGFGGLIVTDCLEMQAIRKHFGTPEGAVCAARAGADLLCISQHAELAAQAAEQIARAVETGDIPESRIDEAAARILAAKARLPEQAPDLSAAGCAAHREAAAAMRLASVTLVRGELPELGVRPLFAGCLAYRSTLASTPPDSGCSFADFFAGRFGGDGLVTPVDPEGAAMEEAVRRLAGHTCLVFGSYNGHVTPGQLELANRLAAAAREQGVPMLAVALRNPYDLAKIDPYAAAVAVYEYTAGSFDALARVLSGGEKARGRLPVSLTQGGCV